jgi:hypothetical protein
MKESKTVAKQRAIARRCKLEAQNSDIDASDSVEIAVDSAPLWIPRKEESVSRSSSDPSGSILYRKTLQTSRHEVVPGKSRSLIVPPTGVNSSCDDHVQERSIKILDIKKRLRVCETNTRGSMKKKLNLENMQLGEPDVPVTYLQGTPLGNTLYKLSLAKNPLRGLPPKLVHCLPMLKHLDLSQCELVSLPLTWNLPQLTKLNLSHNKLIEFPAEVSNRMVPSVLFSDPVFPVSWHSHTHIPPHPSNRRY